MRFHTVYLFEANVRSTLTEAASADHQVVLANQTSTSVAADATTKRKKWIKIQTMVKRLTIYGCLFRTFRCVHTKSCSALNGTDGNKSSIMPTIWDVLFAVEFGCVGSTETSECLCEGIPIIFKTRVSSLTANGKRLSTPQAVNCMPFGDRSVTAISIYIIISGCSPIHAILFFLWS